MKQTTNYLRLEATEWWHNLPLSKRVTILKKRGFTEREIDELTGATIEMLYEEETGEPFKPQETASSNDSLEDRKIVAETSELVDFASAFNDVTNTPILAGYVDSKFEDTKLCLVFGRNRDQVKERMNLICEAVNNYNALKAEVENMKAELKVLANQTGTPQRIAKAIYNIILK